MTPLKNVIFVVTDQQRTDTLGCYGNDVVRTENLDALAASGTRFDRWYTPTAICTPARASLLTGAAPFRHKLLANHERNVGYLEDLADDQWTFPEALRDAGYNCGLIGKWHAGTKKTAADFGFEGPPMEGWHNPVDHPDYLAYLDERGLPPYEISGHMRGVLPNGGPGNLIAARLHQPLEATFEYYMAERAIEMLKRYAEEAEAISKPFFLALHYFGPHLPYIVPNEYFDMYDHDRVSLPKSVSETFAGKPPVQENYSKHWAFDTMTEAESRKLIAVYWGYVTLIDEQVGRVLDTARELGLMDSTAVFFTSDHGEFTGAHRLHDKGPAMYEDIYSTAGIIRMPGGVRGQERQEFVSLTDCTATILQWCGLDPTHAVDSRSLVPLVMGEHPAWDEEIVCEFHGHHFPYPQRMIRDHRYKLVINPESVNELYDLVTDPDELQNRYHHPELEAVRTQLLERLYIRLRKRGDNFHHWMATMFDVGGLDYDPSLSGLDEGSYQSDAEVSNATT